MVAILRWCRGWICLLYPILSSNSTIQYTTTTSINPYNTITTPNSNGSNTKMVQGMDMSVISNTE